MDLPEGKEVIERNGTSFLVTVATRTGFRTEYWLVSCVTCGAAVVLVNGLNGDAALQVHGTWHQKLKTT